MGFAVCKTRLLSSFKEDTPIPERRTPQGEWSDWDNEAYLEEEYVDDDDDDNEGPTPNSSTISREILSYQTSNLLKNVVTNVDKKLSTVLLEQKEADAVYKRDDKDWIGWSEEPPYFDDDDIEEETILEFDKSETAKTKFGYGGERGVDTRSTDLWTKRNIVDDTLPPSSPDPVNPVIKKSEQPESSSPSSSYQQVSSLTSAQPQLDSHASLLLFIEMNRKFESLERKLDSIQALVSTSATSPSSSVSATTSPTSILSITPILATLFLIGYAVGVQVNN
eukprot:gene24748-33222_t